MKRLSVVLICSCLAVVAMIVVSVATADVGAQAPGYAGSCYNGSGTATNTVTYGETGGSLKFTCEIETGDDRVCHDDSRIAPCVQNCDNHCDQCFPRESQWVHWTEGPICVGNCVVDTSEDGGRCYGCSGTSRLICAVGDVYNDEDCDESANLKAWQTWGGSKPCEGDG